MVVQVKLMQQPGPDDMAIIVCRVHVTVGSKDMCDKVKYNLGNSLWHLVVVDGFDLHHRHLVTFGKYE
jgi:hypothetical protein